MKKILSIFVACLSFFIFFISFSSVSEREQNSLLDLHLYQANKQHANFYSVSFENQNAETIVAEIKKFAAANRYSVFMGHQINEGLKKIRISFIYLPKGEELSVFTKQGKKIDYSSSSPFYLSTESEDKNAFDIIDLVDRRNNASYKDIKRIYSLDRFTEMTGERALIVAQFITKDTEEQFRKAMDGSSLSKLAGEISKGDFEIKYTKTDVASYSVLITSAVTILVVFIYYMLKQDKEIAVRKLMGQSACCICRKLFLKQVVSYFFIYLFVQGLCFGYFVHGVRPVTYPFLKELVVFAFSFLLFLLFCYAAMYIFIKNRKQVYSLKKPMVKDVFFRANFLLKLLVLLLIAQPFVLFFKEGIPGISEFIYLWANSEEFKNQFYLSGAYGTLNSSSEDSYVMVNTYMEEHGGEYQDFDSYYGYQAMLQKGIDIPSEILPFIYANEAYLKKYPLVATNGEPIHLKAYQRETLFVPDIYADLSAEDKALYCRQGSQCEIVLIKSGTKLYNHRLNSFTHSLKDPLIVFDPEAYKNPNVNMNGYYLPVRKESDEADFKAFLKENGLDRIFVLQNTSNDYQVAYEKGKDEAVAFLFLLVTYSIVIFSFIYQSIYIYFLEKKQKLALEYLYGDTFLQRHGDLLLNNLFVYVPLLLCLYFFFALQPMEAVIFVVFTVFFEIAASWLLIRLFEKKRLVTILKGE